jgi:SAM-dependent methyltransferase
MSKYLQRGCYHFQEFANPNTTYAKHVDDLIEQLRDKAPFFDRALNPTVYEIGCGEGLILLQIQLRLKWTVVGSDIDPIALSMAKRLNPTGHFNLILVGLDQCDIRGLDVVLFCDSLEHIKDWKEQLEVAKQKAKCIVIAVPDRHDPHGERDFKPDFADEILSGWKIRHRATRHARHLTIWERP